MFQIDFRNGSRSNRIFGPWKSLARTHGRHLGSLRENELESSGERRRIIKLPEILIRKVTGNNCSREFEKFLIFYTWSFELYKPEESTTLLLRISLNHPLTFNLLFLKLFISFNILAYFKNISFFLQFTDVGNITELIF